MSARGTRGFPFVPWLARISAYLVWLAMALPIVGAMPTTGERVTVAVLLAASGVLLGFFLTTERSVRCATMAEALLGPPGRPAWACRHR